MPGSTSLYLAQLLRANPLAALALLICLATILWCILLTRRQRNGLDKILTGLLGLIAIYEALRILKAEGFATKTVLCANDRVAFGVIAVALFPLTVLLVSVTAPSV